MKNLLILLFTLSLLSACASAEKSPATAPVTIRLMTHDSFDIGKATMQAFEEQNSIKVEIFKAGDGGAALNQAILAKDNPLADVFYGVDNTFLSRALDNDIFTPYASPELANIPANLKLDPQNRALPVDYGDVCLNYDKAWFENSPLQPPQSLEDLADSAYAGLTVVENPATSTPGLAFLLASIGHFGEDGYLSYWKQLKANQVSIADGWEDAYWGQFSAASDGDRPIVVSYASSPPAEVYFADPPITESPTAAVISDGTCFRQIEFAGILKGTKHAVEAQKLVDFMLGQTFQEDIPLNMFVYPAKQNAALPDVFKQHSQVPQKPVTLSPADIAAKREAWIEAWTEVMLR
ncbi:MAG TPA: thiamine ABC transporter substrate-binding protein [Chloroflexi bacterium]|nr:thiamine ABC transporter substrate-binding protein [Chloroflexota bacterium]